MGVDMRKLVRRLKPGFELSLALFSNYRLGGWAKTDRIRSKVCFFHDTGNGIAQKLGKY